MPSPSLQTGTFILASIIILLLCSSLFILFTSQQIMIQQRLIHNQFNANQAWLNAESGLQESLARYIQNPQLSQHPSNCLSQPISNLDSHFCSQISSLILNKQNLLKIQVQGIADDSSGNSNLSQSFGLQPWLINTSPAAPLIAGGSVTIAPKLSIRPNPNAAGPGIAVAIWLQGQLNLSSNETKTCQDLWQSTDDCNTNSASLVFNNQNTIQQAASISNGGNFPDNLFSYLLGYPTSSAALIKELAHQLKPAECINLSNTLPASGLYWIEGDGECVIQNAGKADQPATNNFDPQPVVLLLNNVPLKLASHSQIYGYVLLFKLDKTASAIHTLQLTDSGLINGALLSTDSLNITQGSELSLIWTDYSQQLVAPQSSATASLSILAGSWRDFN